MNLERSTWIGIIVAVLTFMIQQPPTIPTPDAPVVVVTPDVPTPDAPNVPTNPVSFEGTCVIVLDESGDRSRDLSARITADQKVQAYLNAKCTAGSKGWRRWDVNAPLEFAPPQLSELMKLPGLKPASVVFTINKHAYVLPLSANMTPEQFIEILVPYLGK